MNDDLKTTQNVYRVLCNAQVLFNECLFAGKHSLALEECKGLIAGIAAETKKKMEPAIVPPSVPSQEPHGDVKFVPPPKQDPASL